MSESKIKEPIVSIDRASKSWACFDGLQLLYGFISYADSDEATALYAAMSWLAVRSPIPPRIVYPRITSMRIS